MIWIFDLQASDMPHSQKSIDVEVVSVIYSMAEGCCNLQKGITRRYLVKKGGLEMVVMNPVILQYQSPWKIVSVCQDSLICGFFNRTAADEIPGCTAVFMVVWEVTGGYCYLLLSKVRRHIESFLTFS